MEIKSSVYDVMSGKDTFTKMTHEIAEYVGHEFDDTGEFCTAGMVSMRLPTLTELMVPTDDDSVKFELWKMAR